MLNSTKVVITRHALEMWLARIGGGDRETIEDHVRTSGKAAKSVLRAYRKFQNLRPERMRHQDAGLSMKEGGKVLLVSRRAGALFVIDVPKKGVFKVLTVHSLAEVGVRAAGV